jgi:hypothetical protein
VRVDVENVSNDSTVETLWALGALEPKKRLKRPDRYREILKSSSGLRPMSEPLTPNHSRLEL